MGPEARTRGGDESLVKDLIGLTQKNPDDIRSRIDLAELYYHRGDRGLSVDQYMEMAKSFTRRGARPKAVAIYNQVLLWTEILNTPGHPGAAQFLESASQAAFALGNKDRFKDLLKKAAHEFDAQGDIAERDRVLWRVLQLDPDDAEALKMLGFLEEPPTAAPVEEPAPVVEPAKVPPAPKPVAVAEPAKAKAAVIELGPESAVQTPRPPVAEPIAKIAVEKPGPPAAVPVTPPPARAVAPAEAKFREPSRPTIELDHQAPSKAAATPISVPIVPAEPAVAKPTEIQAKESAAPIEITEPEPPSPLVLEEILEKEEAGESAGREVFNTADDPSLLQDKPSPYEMAAVPTSMIVDELIEGARHDIDELIGREVPARARGKSTEAGRVQPPKPEKKPRSSVPVVEPMEVGMTADLLARERANLQKIAAQAGRDKDSPSLEAMFEGVDVKYVEPVEVDIDWTDTGLDSAGRAKHELSNALGEASEDITLFGDVESGEAIRDLEYAEAQDSHTHYNLGIAYLEVELYDEAIREFEWALKDPKMLFHATCKLGKCYRAKGELNRAVEYLEKALDAKEMTSNESVECSYDLAMILINFGDKKRAKNLLTEIELTYPGYKDVRKLMGRV